MNGWEKVKQAYQRVNRAKRDNFNTRRKLERAEKTLVLNIKKLSATDRAFYNEHINKMYLNITVKSNEKRRTNKVR